MRLLKRGLKLILMLVMVFCLLVMETIVVFAAGNTFGAAADYTIGKTVSGSITDTNSKDLYKFTLPTSGCVTFDVTAYIYCTDYYIYDSGGNTVWECTWQQWNETSEVLMFTESIDMVMGTYYFCVEQDDGTGDYEFSTSFTSAEESFHETTGGVNNNMKNASSITVGEVYKGQLAVNDTKDFYKFVLPESGRITLNVNAYIYCTDYYIYDSGGNTVWECTRQYWDDTSEVLMFTDTIDLVMGTYYFCVEQRSGTGNYEFNTSYTSAGESFSETTGGINNNMKDASSIAVGEVYKGQLATNDTKDFYKFVLSKAEKITLDMTAYISCTNYYIYDNSGNVVWELKWQNWDWTSEMLTFTESIDLVMGTYYFCVEKYDGTGNYQFGLYDAVGIGNVDAVDGITAADALLALQIATGKIQPTEAQMQAGDVDTTTGISANDALLILQYATKKIAKFPIVG